MFPLSSAIPEVPKQTARVAHASFPKGNVYLWLRDELGQLYVDEDFADLYALRGQPGYSSWRLAMVCVMQFMEELTDAEAADAVRGNIAWKYALALELEDSGFDASILSEFRARLLVGKSEQKLLELLLSRLQEGQWFPPARWQRTDSTHVMAAIHQRNRLELVSEMLRSALNKIASTSPEWLASWMPSVWVERYRRAVDNYHLPKTPQERTEYGEQVGADGMVLLERLEREETPQTLSELKQVEYLRQCWQHHFYLEAGKIKMRPASELSPSGERMDAPYEPDARYGNKRSKQWTGYKVHVSETCEPEQVHLITNVETNPAHIPDIDQTETIHQHLADKMLLPARHYLDSGYVDADVLVQSRHQYGIEVVGPVRPDPSWQAKDPQAYDISVFAIDWENKSVTCPQGKTNVSWTESTDRWSNPVISVNFSKPVCGQCPARSLCTRSLTYPRSLTLHPQREHEALQAARQQQTTEQWQEEYQVRAGVEGTISQAIVGFGLRHARYRGLAKTHLQHILTAVAINLKRLFAWVQGVPHAKTRRSPLESLNHSVA